MQVAEILTEMAFPKAVAEAKVRAKEETINLHVVKLLAFAVDEGVKTYWRKEIRAATELLAGYSIRGQRKVRRISAREYYQMLYAEPFEHNEVPYTRGLIRAAMTKADQEGRPLQRNNRDVSEIAAAIQPFHAALAKALHAGDDGSDLLTTLGD